MPHQTFDVKEVAHYLHLDLSDVERLVKDQEIPFERHGPRLIFRRFEIDSWASPRVLGLQGSRLAEYHRKTCGDSGKLVRREAVLPELLRPEFISPALPAKTKASAVREMAALAGKTGRVWDMKGLVTGLEERESLCSTGLPGGLALLHTRSAQTYLFESTFIVLGRTVQAIPFGAPDGKPTDLFFLFACSDDRLHLQTLARLCLMAQQTELLAELRIAADPEGMYQALLAAEQAVL